MNENKTLIVIEVINDFVDENDACKCRYVRLSFDCATNYRNFNN